MRIESNCDANHNLMTLRSVVHHTRFVIQTTTSRGDRVDRLAFPRRDYRNNPYNRFWNCRNTNLRRSYHCNNIKPFRIENQNGHYWVYIFSYRSFRDLCSCSFPL